MDRGFAVRIHLLAIDLDGTLLSSAKRVSDATATAVRDARHRGGVHVVLATARPPRTVMPFYRLLDLDAPMINYNGALVYDPSSDRVLMHRPIPLKTSLRIVHLARQMFPDILISGEILDRWYTDRVDPKHLTETARLCKPDQVAPIEKWMTQAVTKLLILGQPQKLTQIAAAIYKEYLHQVSVVQIDSDLLQIMHATVSKAQALRVIAGEMGIMRENVMAIGDNANDVGMLTWAGMGVAVANAVPQALAAAKMITDSNDHDGVANAIRKVVFEE